MTVGERGGGPERDATTTRTCRWRIVPRSRTADDDDDDDDDDDVPLSRRKAGSKPGGRGTRAAPSSAAADSASDGSDADDADTLSLAATMAQEVLARGERGDHVGVLRVLSGGAPRAPSSWGAATALCRPRSPPRPWMHAPRLPHAGQPLPQRWRRTTADGCGTA